ncbi:MAG: rane-bound dehydrogenase domain protein [Planctomycetaceae bacterium]|nr:rane-bound dehydrogenase domain protein [Planctomycetaceae bacterium]
MVKTRRLTAALLCGLLLLGMTFTPAARADDEVDFKPLFNGKDLEGWDGNPKFWSVKDGAITGTTTKENPTAGNTFLIWKDGVVDDFVLRLEFKIVGGNSGIQYRSKDYGNWVVGGYQGDFEAGDTYSGILYEERGKRGIMAQRGEKTVFAKDGSKTAERFAESKSLQEKIKKEDWNEYEISAQGGHLVHKINGNVTADVTDNDEKLQVLKGILALQLHAGPPMVVQFKNIRIKRVKLADGRKKAVLVAGRPSHGPGDHEHNAGVLLMQKALENTPGILVETYHNGWPKDKTAFDNADTILFYSDGGGGHPAIQEDHLALLHKLMEKGIGMCCIHYAVEVPKERGGSEFLDWIGGYFEAHWSVNPHWTAKFDQFPDHPVTRGVKPFEINDEWYYHMRFRDKMVGVTPLLTALPPKSTLERGDGPHSGNPAVREAIAKGEVQHVAWAAERAGGGRGFGFTGGHVHKNWSNDSFRKLVLNAIVWTAHAEVSADGVQSTLSADDISKNLDPKGK